MTLRDLTPRQRDRLIRRMGKQLRYWERRPKGLQPLDNHGWFRTGYNDGVKAVLDILLTPKPPKNGQEGT